MKSKVMNSKYSYNNFDINQLNNEIDLYSFNAIKNNNFNPKNNHFNINSLDVDILLDNTQNSLDEFITTLTNEDNLNPKSHRKIPYNNLYNNSHKFKFNKEITNINNSELNANIQNDFKYNRNFNDIIESQDNLERLNRDISYKNRKNKTPINKNKKLFRKKTDNNIFQNKSKNKKTDTNSEIKSPLLNSSYNKRAINKRDISPVGFIDNTNNMEKSFEHQIKININKKNFDIINNKNKLLMNENEKIKKELRNYIILSENLKKENSKLKQKIKEQKNNNNNLSISTQYFSINRKPTNKVKEISNLKKEIKQLKSKLNKYYKNENKNINLSMEHDINIDQLEKMKKENNNLEKQNIFLITELNNIKKNQNFILTNNFLDKKNKSLNTQILNLKKKLKNYNNLQIYLKMFLQIKNNNNIENEKEEFLIRKMQEELQYIQEKPKTGRQSFPSFNFLGDLNDDNYNVNEKI